MPGKSKKGGGLESKPSIMMKASPEKKAKAKAKAIQGGMPSEVANKVFKMQMGSKSMKNSDSAFSMYSEDVMKMSPLFAHKPGHNDPPSDKLPSYTEKNTSVSRSATTTSGSGETKSTSNLSDYKKGLKDLGPGFKPTAEQTAAANKKVADLKKKDSDASKFNDANKKVTTQGGVSKKTKISSKTLGDKTQKDILDAGKEQLANRKSKMGAYREAAMNKAQGDSIKVAQKHLKDVGAKRKLQQRDVDRASKYGNIAGAKSMMNAYSKKEVLGRQMNDQKLFSSEDAKSAFGSERVYNRPKIEGYSKMSKKKKKKAYAAAGPRTSKVVNTGTHSAIPKLSDLQMNIGDKALKFYNRDK